jgi:hypothetical protein
MTFDSLQIHNVQLGTAASSQNSLREWIYTWSYSTTDTECRLSPVSNKYKKDLPGYLQEVSYQIFLDSDVDVNAGDRLQYNSNEYIVRSITLDSSSHHKTGLIEEL